MKAIVQSRYGSPDLLELRQDVARPTLEDDAALVRVRAAAVNAGDWRQVRGSPVVLRLAGGLRRPRTGALGVDVAGVVEAVGARMTSLRVGDAVMGMVPSGAFAEYVSGGWFVRKPEDMSFEAAAAVPAAGCTALQAVRDKGAVVAGQRVLINGAGGGVGTFALQIAKAYGAEVTAASKHGNADLLRSVGADDVIEHDRLDLIRGGPRYDVIIDVGAASPISPLLRALTPRGRLVLVAAGKGPGGPVTRLIGALVRARLLRQRVVAFIASPAGFEENLHTLRGLMEEGQLKPVIDRTYPLSETAAAIRHVESGRARGKVVITV